MWRCEQITRELSAPIGGAPASALAEHLASCPSCGAWAQDVQRQDAWFSPSEPPSRDDEGFDAAWGTIVNSAEVVRQERAEVSRRWRTGVGWGLAGLAQAAVVLLVFGAWWKGQTGPSPVPGPPLMAMTIVIDEGEVGLLRWDGDDVSVERTSFDADAEGEEGGEFLAADFQVLNHMEGLAQ